MVYRGAKKRLTSHAMKQMGLVSFRVKLNDGTVCQTHQDQICRQHDSVDTAPMPTMVEPPNLDTSVPPATATFPEIPNSSLSPQRHDSTKQAILQNMIVHVMSL